MLLVATTTKWKLFPHIEHLATFWKTGDIRIFRKPQNLRYFWLATSKPALHLSERTHECSSSFTHPTLKLIVANPGYEGIATTRGTASGLVFGTDFNFGYLLTGTNQMNCRSSLAESNSTLNYKYTYFICSLIYTSDDCVLKNHLKGGGRWSIPNNH